MVLLFSFGKQFLDKKKKVKKKNYLNIVQCSEEIQYRIWHVSTGKVWLPDASCQPTADSVMFKQLTVYTHSTDDIGTKALQEPVS